MSKLRLGAILDEKPVKLTVDLPAAIHRDLLAYAKLLARETGQTIDPAKLVAPMLGRFMATDRAFTRERRIARRVESTGSDSK
ncbi:DUF2274 domain-containing protein [Reyranella sp.]|uniref:DUF2274 domain-containing protein n=1 Tax=Reyranella sp. TaxID=1929291 RepID=UPI00272FB30B|nr:DUF2274 domain-containing protein [Reyranella sp.]MDP2373601.1 DUF2274 domain-containing protein [Reyranella sp.]